MKRHELLILAVTAVLSRLIVWQTLDYELSGDAQVYEALATNLQSTGTLALTDGENLAPSVLRPPLYPAFLALAQVLTTRWVLLAQVIQLLLSTAAALLLGIVARKVFGSSGRFAAVLLALNPFDGPFVAAILTETLSTFLIAIAVISLALCRGNRRFILAGVFAALAALTRDLFLVLPLALAAFVYFRWRTNLGVRRAAMLLATSALVILPWSIRNLVQFGKVIPIAAGGLEYNAWIGTWESNPDWTAGPTYPDEAFPSVEHRKRFDELGGRFYGNEARQLFKEMTTMNWGNDAFGVFVRCVWRVRLSWLGTRTELFRYRVPGLRDRGALTWKAVKGVQWLTNFALLAAGVAFLMFARRAGPRGLWLRWLILPPILVTVAAYLPMHSVESRYSQPVLQLMVLAAGVGLAQLLRNLRKPSRAAVR